MEHTPTILFQVLIGAAAVWAMLFTLAARLGFDVELHKLRVEACTLRRQYELRIAALKGAAEADSAPDNR